MQIRRFDTEAHGLAIPRNVGRSVGSSDGAVSNPSLVESAPKETDASDSRFKDLSTRLQNVKQIRTAAVEAAREKLSKGEFITRAAAERLAATDLRFEVF